MSEVRFDPRVVCAFCETILPLANAPTLREQGIRGGRIVGYMCDKHADLVKPNEHKQDRT